MRQRCGERGREEYLVRDRALENLRSNTYLSGTSVRDFLLAGDDRRAALSKAQFLDKERAIRTELESYRKLVTPQTKQPFLQFRDELLSWFSDLHPVLEWDAATCRLKGYICNSPDFSIRKLSAMLGKDASCPSPNRL